MRSPQCHHRGATNTRCRLMPPDAARCRLVLPDTLRDAVVISLPESAASIVNRHRPSSAVGAVRCYLARKRGAASLVPTCRLQTQTHRKEKNARYRIFTRISKAGIHSAILTFKIVLSIILRRCTVINFGGHFRLNIELRLPEMIFDIRLRIPS